MENDDLPAMPVALTDAQLTIALHANPDFKSFGMTKREMMAMHIMTGLLSGDKEMSGHKAASLAVYCAECLLGELEG